MEEEVVGMEYVLEQVMQKDLGRRLQVGPEVIELILDEDKSPELEQDQSLLDRTVDAVASSWVNSSNFKVRHVQVSWTGRCTSDTPTEQRRVQVTVKQLRKIIYRLTVDSRDKHKEASQDNLIKQTESQKKRQKS